MPRLKKLQRKLDFSSDFFMQDWQKSEASENDQPFRKLKRKLIILRYLITFGRLFFAILAIISVRP